MENKNYLREFKTTITYSNFPEKGITQEDLIVNAVNRMDAFVQGIQTASERAVIDQDLGCDLIGEPVENEKSLECTIAYLADLSLNFARFCHWPLADEFTEEEAEKALEKIVKFGDEDFEDELAVQLYNQTYDGILEIRGINKGDLKFPGLSY